ncbi:MAG: RluA family pseudouridine synthase [Clostridia bacterium]|nr:RluA family pseudouridine synthase [Clostridia bacterium]
MIDIIHIDNDIIVCIKPAGLLSEGEGPESLLTVLADQCGGQVYPIHRLDRGASGLMVFARHSKAAAGLSRAVQEKQLKKEYFALISGVPAEKEGELTDYLFKDSRKGKVFAVSRPRKGVRDARLTYRTLWNDGENALVRVALDTGRTHQIRVQFSSRGMPLWGDGKYGSRVKGELALFSCDLGFPHPKTGKPMTFEAKPQGAPWDTIQGDFYDL